MTPAIEQGDAVDKQKKQRGGGNHDHLNRMRISVRNDVVELSKKAGSSMASARVAYYES